MQTQTKEERANRVWELRAEGKLLREIAKLLPKADGSDGFGVTKARAHQILLEEGRRRLADADNWQEVQRIFGEAKTRALKPDRDLALKRVDPSGDSLMVWIGEAAALVRRRELAVELSAPEDRERAEAHKVEAGRKLQKLMQQAEKIGATVRAQAAAERGREEEDRTIIRDQLGRG